ncbi:hypothetical protein CC85DRAFT_19158 [Cutaneotrichosporon oleaginosum]|uniref:Uncharacterized protein n=1 Tax=Cutaneotrichosporon oleaginosum TaxID=879819 RepID=A0A0J0XCE6_9TREE|nr:uncharacterized protein CC85DRAFT_19158 [Cutaneotrichosporon oleaginosum]KLT38740.1 hypothetical protein CC85DRAFT_19158 [Cutaneotrichosporon oleaginosum]TXT06904.1 hypothetical protein COLE_06235 [Cutaneotrichosporon oleaginosum]
MKSVEMQNIKTELGDVAAPENASHQALDAPHYRPAVYLHPSKAWTPRRCISADQHGATTAPARHCAASGTRPIADMHVRVCPMIASRCRRPASFDSACFAAIVVSDTRVNPIQQPASNIPSRPVPAGHFATRADALYLRPQHSLIKISSRDCILAPALAASTAAGLLTVVISALSFIADRWGLSRTVAPAFNVGSRAGGRQVSCPEAQTMD